MWQPTHFTFKREHVRSALFSLFLTTNLTSSNMSSSSVVEVVDITNDNVTTVKNVVRMELKGVPTPQARPRLGRGGFHSPKAKGMAAFKAKIKGSVPETPMFDSNKAVWVDVKFFMRRPKTAFKGDNRSNVPEGRLAHCTHHCP